MCANTPVPWDSCEPGRTVPPPALAITGETLELALSPVLTAPSLARRQLCGLPHPEPTVNAKLLVSTQTPGGGPRSCRLHTRSCPSILLTISSKLLHMGGNQGLGGRGQRKTSYFLEKPHTKHKLLVRSGILWKFTECPLSIRFRVRC